MKQEDQLINKYGKDSGMRVPEGYFPDLQKRILESLPPYERHIRPSLSRWQKVKPYVYLAAMFCGIWLMMKVFHTATQPMSMNLDNPPAALVELLDGGLDYDFHYMFEQLPYDSEEEDFIMSYDNIEDFEKDFNYNLKPEYSRIITDLKEGKNS